MDESGSMSSLRDATLSGVNETINSIRGAQNEFVDTQEHFLTLVTFDSNRCSEPVRTLYNRKPIAEVEDFKNYNPSGCTPLYGAVDKRVV